MVRVRVQRLLRLIDESRPFQHASDGQLSVRKLELAYHDICLLAETSVMDLSAGNCAPAAVETMKYRGAA